MKEGVLIIGHGSRLNSNKDIVELNAQRLRDMGFKNVYTGFNEMSEPAIEETLEKMAKDGIDTIYALPLFISSGVHLTEDIPEKMGIPINTCGGTAVIAGKKVFIKYATSIGDDPRIADILADRIKGMK
jgi:sirohydrochlorin cobaltochelatase